MLLLPSLYPAAACTQTEAPFPTILCGLHRLPEAGDFKPKASSFTLRPQSGQLSAWPLFLFNTCVTQSQGLNASGEVLVGHSETLKHAILEQPSNEHLERAK